MAKAEQMPKQHYFVSNRDITVTSVHGYSIKFEKGVPTHVPKKIHAEVMEKGMLACDESGKPLDLDAQPELPSGPEVAMAPEDADERNEAISAAMEKIVKRNNPHDFSAGGVPSAGAVTLSLGWKVDSREIRPLWNKMKEKLASAGK